MICPQCSTENHESTKKCISCKSRLMLGASGNGLLIGVFCAVAVMIIFISAYFFITNQQANEITRSNTVQSDLFAATGEGSNIHGAMHKIEYNGVTLYLFGTMHAAAPEWFPLADFVEDAMRRADKFAFEVEFDIANLSPAELIELAVIATDMYLTNQTLTDVIPARVYDSLIRYIDTYGMTHQEISRMNPLLLAMTLELNVVGEVFAQFGIYYDEQLGVDGYIMDFANRNNIPTIGLEPVTQQMRIAFAPNEEILQRANFNGTLNDIFYESLDELLPREELMNHFLENMVIHEYYLHNNIQGIVDSMRVSSEDMKNAFTRYMVQVLMNYRSTYYALQIAELLRTSEEGTTIFVAVGLSHVVREGEYLTNIVEQLELLEIIAQPIYRQYQD